MKSLNRKFVTYIHQPIAAVLVSALAASAIACSSKSSTPVSAAQPVAASARPVVSAPAAVRIESNPTKARTTKPSAQMLAYASRDYGVSFLYPWQYSRIGPRALAQGDASLRPVSDGSEGQKTLVRIQIPKGFYPDTNYDSGYLALSVNTDLDQRQCEATLAGTEEQKPQLENINGADFRWTETDVVGGGSASKLRNYAAFSNGTCYELEIGVKTSNEQGLSREVNPDQVLRRLDAMLRTVKIQPNVQNIAGISDEESATATETSPESSQQ
jgi:hypothetical protein